MENKEYIESLIYRTIEYPDGNSDEEIKKMYKEIQEVFKSNKYSKEEKELLYKKAHLETLAMLYDGVE